MSVLAQVFIVTLLLLNLMVLSQVWVQMKRIADYFDLMQRGDIRFTVLNKDTR